MEEIWKDIVLLDRNLSFAGFYKISNTCKCLSIRTGKILKDRIDKKGYNNVCLFNGVDRIYAKMSRVVAFAFPEICGEYFEGAEIDHINGIRKDNRPENLKWVTHKENVNNPLTLERFKHRNHKAHPKETIIKGITFKSRREAAKFFNVSEGYIYAYISGRIKNPKLLFNS